MADDSFGRPSSPVCGLSSHGLFFRAWTDWTQIPERQRCQACDATAAGSYGDPAGNS